MRKPDKSFYFCALFVALYLTLIFITPVDPAALARYKITEFQSRLYTMPVIIIVCGVWFALFYGFVKLRDYAKAIRHTKDGRQFARVAKGLMILAYGIPISAIVSNVVTYLTYKHPEWIPAGTIIRNYVNILVPLLGFTAISTGGRGLADLVKKRPSLTVTRLLILAYILIGAIYCYLLFDVNGRVLSVESLPRRSYYLPDWLLLPTIVVPYLYMWFIGLFAAYEIHLFRKTVQGVLYKKGLELLSVGIGMAVLSSISIQYLTSLLGRLNRLSLSMTLLVIYSLLILLAGAYILIALGSKKLHRIEEV